MAVLRRFWHDESANALLEYALLGGCVAAACATFVYAFREQLMALADSLRLDEADGKHKPRGWPRRR